MCTVRNLARGYAEVGGLPRGSSVSFARRRRLSLCCESSASSLLTDTDYDHVRSLLLRYDCRARIRRIHNPGCRQTRLQIAPNRAQLGARPGLYDDDIGDAHYYDKGKHDRVFYRRWIVQEGHRDPGLGLSIGGCLLKGHAGTEIF